jgi:hypothetical protein
VRRATEDLLSDLTKVFGQRPSIQRFIRELTARLRMGRSPSPFQFCACRGASR